MRLRIRGPGGQTTATFPETATVADLRSKITECTSLSEFEVKYGYPPQPLVLEDDAGDFQLSQLGFKLDGEQLIVSANEAAASDSNAKGSDTTSLANGNASTDAGAENTSFLASEPATSPPGPVSLSRKPAPQDPPELPLPSRNGTLLLRIMPDDNSCLFRAFNSAYLGGMDNMHELRSIVAQSIQADPETYSAVVLEKAPDDYCRWIQSPDAWGGQIELQILAKHFDIEICSIDVQTLRVDRYNEGRPKRCIVVYSGIHYDVIAVSPSDPPFDKAYAPPEFDEKVFDASNDEITNKAVELCGLLNKRGYFTDTASFSVKCNVCGGIFVGEIGAAEHAKEMGHYDFGEA